jgi:hypothetical protein
MVAKRRIGGQTTAVLESTERISKPAFAQVKADTQQMQAKTERLRRFD